MSNGWTGTRVIDPNVPERVRQIEAEQAAEKARLNDPELIVIDSEQAELLSKLADMQQTHPQYKLLMTRREQLQQARAAFLERRPELATMDREQFVEIFHRRLSGR